MISKSASNRDFSSTDMFGKILGSLFIVNINYDLLQYLLFLSGQIKWYFMSYAKADNWFPSATSKLSH